MTEKTLDQDVLAQFTGTEQCYRHPLARRVLYTDGAKYVADAAGAYWLIDEVAFNQSRAKLRSEEFQVWKLTVGAGNGARLAVDDGNGNKLFAKRIPFTDFPAPGITFFFTGSVIMLPSEY